ncbi:hypothetical protein [uncultured Desulfuromonas sp.]|uniref:hypothetical protein n=1 Tax=uncultured Desulfuromonas sp. TaxID=181013 RepID=UPI002609A39F|nr:hypothetical protein [uncultured Desulfuromonas sp.]
MFRLCLAITTLVLLAASGTAAATGEWSGYGGIELRVFPRSPAFPEQERSTLSPSLELQPEIRLEWNDGNDRITVIPFLRLDADDDQRTHGDLRELNWLHLERSWDLRLGLGKVFWGVAESRHLIDIVNQTDLVEDVDAEEKLGQPMANLNLLSDWGTFGLFALPGFRERTFPDGRARLRGILPIDTDEAAYESSREEARIDWAGRWSRVFGDWDIGLGHFRGTSREPRLVPAPKASGKIVLVPHYDIIGQTSLDLQATKGSWLWKLEAMTRSGQGKRFGALVGGFEYTLFGLRGSAVDLGLLGEYLYDGRDDEAPVTPWDDDLFLGLRLSPNDVQSSELLAGVLWDRDNGALMLNLEASRRIGRHWIMEVEGRIFSDIPNGDPLAGLARDDFARFRLKRFF